MSARGDEGLRLRERATATGEPGAREALRAEQLRRAVLCSWCGDEPAAWGDEDSPVGEPVCRGCYERSVEWAPAECVECGAETEATGYPLTPGTTFVDTCDECGEATEHRVGGEA